MKETILELQIKRIIQQIRDAGYTDPTKGAITYKMNEKQISIQLYNQEQWEKYLKTLPTAMSWGEKHGFKPCYDTYVVESGIKYYVKHIEE